MSVTSQVASVGSFLGHEEVRFIPCEGLMAAPFGHCQRVSITFYVTSGPYRTLSSGTFFDVVKKA